MNGTLYILSTPIGNLEDISIRAIQTLFSVDYLLTEDTRTTGILLSELKKRYPSFISSNAKKPELVSYYNEVEISKSPEMINKLLQGKNCALVSDAGTPLISDPGFVLIREAIKRNIPLTSIPGPSAVVTALTLSGLPIHSFYFGGYLPKEQGKRIKLIETLFKSFETLKNRPTFIFYEAPHRLKESLEDLKSINENLSIVVARELTKIHEELFRGNIKEAISHFTNPKGEFVILV